MDAQNGEIREPLGWFDPPAENKDLHEVHLDLGLVVEYSELPGYQCCVDQIDEWISKKKWCFTHKRDLDSDGLCYGCEREAGKIIGARHNA